MKIKDMIISCILFVFLSVLNSYAEQLNPGDGVRITFYNISDANSGDFFVQQDSSLQLPYIGLINTSHRPYSELKNEIIAKYDSLYRGVELIVRPLYKISVLGEVRSPGVYYVTGVEKLLDVIAMAGGETADANVGGIRINRNNQEIKVDMDRIIKRAESKSDFYLKSGDRVYVPRKWWVGYRSASFLISGLAVIVTIVGLFLRY